MSKENEVTQEVNLDSEGFFDQLENDVNGGVADGGTTYNAPTQATQMDNGPQQEVTQEPAGTKEVDWEKRYKDSSREAQRMASEMSQLKPFVPVLEAMKQDSGLVEHVRGYLESGGTSASVTDRLGLGEDFQYDHTEAMENPNSDSGKVFQTHVDEVVNKRVANTLDGEKRKAMVAGQQQRMVKEVDEFRKKHNMNEADFKELQEAASARKLTLDDVFYLVNRDKANENVASNTRKDMLGQMKNVRNIPATASGANNQGSNKAQHDDVFDALLDQDSELDKLFG